MKFFVLGCNGMAGHLISLYLKEQGYDVTGFARSKSKLLNKTVVGDARDLNLLEKTIKNGHYDSIINCIGLLNKFAENDHEAAVFLNSYLPHFLAKVTADTFTQVIQMSTDCVFSGAKGGYTEDSLPDGTLFYDQSKALGELNDNKNVTLRNSIVGPDINQVSDLLIGFFNNMIKLKVIRMLSGLARLHYSLRRQWKKLPFNEFTAFITWYRSIV